MKPRQFLLYTACLVFVFAGCSGGKTSGTGSSTTLASNSGGKSNPSNPVPGTESSAGGGNAVVCFDDPAIAPQVRAAGEMDDQFVSHIRSVEMLDLFCAKEAMGLDQPAPELVEMEKSESPSHYVHRTVWRFLDFTPMVSLLVMSGDAFFHGYLNAVAAMKPGVSGTLYQENGSNIRRSAHGNKTIYDADADENLPDSCALVTMAVQRNSEEWEKLTRKMLDEFWDNSTNYDRSRGSHMLQEMARLPAPELLIDDRLYNHPLHSELSKAVMLLHEYVYLRVRTIFGDKDSRSVRKLIGYLVRKKPSYTDIELTRFLMDTWLTKYADEMSRSGGGAGAFFASAAENDTDISESTALGLVLRERLNDVMEEFRERAQDFHASGKNPKFVEDMKAYLKKTEWKEPEYLAQMRNAIAQIYSDARPDSSRFIRSDSLKHLDEEITEFALPSLAGFENLDRYPPGIWTHEEESPPLSCYSKSFDGKQDYCLSWAATWAKRLKPSRPVPEL